MQVTPSQDNRQTRLRRPQPQRTSSPKSPRLNRLDRPLAGLDTETTGIDYRHGCRPYYVSIYKLDPKTGEDDCWEWEWFVDPFTRIPACPPEDLRQLQDIIDKLLT